MLYMNILRRYWLGLKTHQYKCITNIRCVLRARGTSVTLCQSHLSNQTTHKCAMIIFTMCGYYPSRTESLPGDTRHPIYYPIKHLVTWSHEVSNIYRLNYRIALKPLQVYRHQYWRESWQFLEFSERSDDSEHKSGGLNLLWNLTMGCLLGYWDRR